MSPAWAGRFVNPKQPHLLICLNSIVIVIPGVSDFKVLYLFLVGKCCTKIAIRSTGGFFEHQHSKVANNKGFHWQDTMRNGLLQMTSLM